MMKTKGKNFIASVIVLIIFILFITDIIACVACWFLGEFIMALIMFNFAVWGMLIIGLANSNSIIQEKISALSPTTISIIKPDPYKPDPSKPDRVN